MERDNCNLGNLSYLRERTRETTNITSNEDCYLNNVLANCTDVEINLDDININLNYSKT